jgi:hypothetical protein
MVNGIYWRERRLIGKLYMDQSVKPKLDQGQKKSMKIGRGVRQGCCLSPILFNLYSEYLTKETCEVFGGFKIGRRVNRNVKHADGLVLLEKEEVLLHDITESLHDIGRYYGMEINVEKPKVMRNSRQPSAIQTTGVPRCATDCYATIHNKDGCEN